MTKFGLKPMVLPLLLLAGALMSHAQPTASPASLTFTYQVNTSSYPSASLTATLPKSLGSGYTLTAAVNSSTTGWLTVAPASGASPLKMTVSVNPTGLNPGSYNGLITLGTNPASTTSTVAVSLAISNPPSALSVSPPTPIPTYYTSAGSGGNAALVFNYTTGTPAVDNPFEEMDVSSNGGIIPFSVAAAAAAKSSAWLKVNVANQVPNLATSGVALSGSYVPIYASVEFTVLSTLDVGSYTGTVTFTNNTSGGTVVVNVTLNISAGAPTINTIFPTSVLAAPAAGRVAPVVTIYGDNFFATSSVTLTPDGSVPYPNLTSHLITRKILQATIDPNFVTTPGSYTLKVANGKTLANPTPQEDSITFIVADPTVPLITSIVNAASYLPKAFQSGSLGDPVPATGAGNTAVSPREIIAIFGQNLGPGVVTQVAATTGEFPNSYPPSAQTGITPNTTTYQVMFSFGVDPTCVGACPAVQLVPAPLIMVSSNQINAIVPRPPQTVQVPVSGLSWVQVTETADATGFVTSTDWFPLTVLAEDPGIFTFGGLGQGQGAALNYDATAGYSINSAKNPAAKGSTISLYANGMGDLMAGVQFTVTDNSATPQSVPVTLPLVINPSQTPGTAPSIVNQSPLPSGTQNRLYTPVTLLGSGGTPPYQWSVAGLPGGMSMNAAGLLTGTPTLLGTSNATFTLIDNSSPKQTASATLSLTVAPDVIVIPSAFLLPDGVESIAYTPITLAATGGKAPNSWSVDPSSTLPPWLSLSRGGLLTGTPGVGAAGNYQITFQVQDSSSPPLTASTPAYSFNIYPSPGMAITSPSLPDGVELVPYSAALAKQGGTGPFTWSAAPPGFAALGLTLDPAKGLVTGKPTLAGQAMVIVTVTDSSGVLSATYPVSININWPLQITTVALPGNLYQYQALPATAMQATGGTVPYRWTAAGLPPGLVLDRNTGVLSGVPTTQISLPLKDGGVSLGAVYLNDNTYRVDIDGQPAVTSYGGASQGSVAGLVQINAVVPPTARSGAAIPLTVSIGNEKTARRSQLGVTLAVK